MKWLACLLLISVSFVIPAPVAAEAFWPGATYDATIPTFEEVLGYAPGERIASHAEIMRYMRALEGAAPDRIKLFPYAESWEGRELLYAAVGNAERIRNLEEHSRSMARLSDPRVTDKSEAESLIASMPVPVWLGYGVHGNEIASCDAAMFTAYHLLAATNGEVVKSVLANTIVLIDPTQNPDGRDRFVHHYRRERGLEPDENRVAAEHNEPWPGGRTNHYLFDMNRDWVSMTQPETKGRIAVFRKRRPVVVVDLHEMGGDSTYYFAPPAEPHNPHLTPAQHGHLERIGRTNAKWFDRFGFDYFTREVYDWFYPGYGDSWPAFYGAVASTYEQASARGMLWRQRDGDLMTFRDTVHRHFVASISTSAAAAENREDLLRDYYGFQVSALDDGKRGDTRAYVLPLEGDESLVHKLAGLLTQQGVEVFSATESFSVEGRDIGEGAYIVPLAQPMGRFVRTMLDPEVSMTEEFLAEQERRRAKRLPDEIYDVTAWSFPHRFNVGAIPVSRVPRVEKEPATDRLIHPGAAKIGADDIGYIVPWGTTAAARFMTAALRAGLTILSADKPFLQNGRTYPGGSLVLKASDNPDGLAATVTRLAEQTGADVIGTDTSWVDEGVNFGSRHVVKLRAPRVALAWDTPTSVYSAGATRFILEREFNYPVTTIRTRQLGSADLDSFDVLILPAGSYSGVLGRSGTARLQDWVSDGGTLIGLGSALGYLTSEDAKLLDVAVESLAGAEAKADDDKKKDSKGTILESEEDYLKAIQAKESPPDNVPGVLLRAHVDEDHWLGAGLAETLNVMYRGRQIATPIALDKGVNVARFGAADEVVVSGYLWEENSKQLAFKPFIVVQPRGRGFVVAFTSDPTSRAYLDGLYLAFLNAVFRAPAHATPAQ